VCARLLMMATLLGCVHERIHVVQRDPIERSKKERQLTEHGMEQSACRLCFAAAGELEQHVTLGSRSSDPLVTTVVASNRMQGYGALFSEQRTAA
jgi:hypothetical protein